MGRGRQRAKATKQARIMKYYSPNTDYSALQRELSYLSRNNKQSLNKTKNRDNKSKKKL